MRTFRKDSEMRGEDFRFWLRPCIYSWWRGSLCLYIGQSKQGFGRFPTHHAIGVYEPVRDDDVFRFYHPKDGEPEDHLDFVEEKWIKEYRPKYNKAKNHVPYERAITEAKLPTMWSCLHSQEKVAEVLHAEMSEHELVVNPRNCTVEQLEEKLRGLKRVERGLERHQYLAQKK